MLLVERRPAPSPLVVTLAVVALLALSNVATNRLLPGASYVPWNLALAVVLVVITLRFGGCDLDDIGLDPSRLRAGLAWGAGALGLVVAVLTIGAVLPLTRGLFEDSRVLGASGWTTAYQAAVRIPLGTVVLEEVAFRGVLLGLLMRRMTTARAVVISCLLFGLWHVLPAWNVAEHNPVFADLFGGALGQLFAVSAAVVGTALAGSVFVFLRLRSASLLAPMLLHVATNSAGFVVAWFVLRSV